MPALPVNFPNLTANYSTVRRREQGLPFTNTSIGRDGPPGGNALCCVNLRWNIASSQNERLSTLNEVFIPPPPQANLQTTLISEASSVFSRFATTFNWCAAWPPAVSPGRRYAH